MSTAILTETRESFIAAIAAEPNDHSRKLVYADWLDENGGIGERIEATILRNGYAVSNDVAAVYGWPKDSLSLPREVAMSRDACLIAKWIEDNLPAILKRVHEINLRLNWLEAAKTGDVNAILSHPQIRAAMTQGGITSYTTKRKAIAAAKAKMEARIQRRADRKIAEAARKGVSGRVHAAWIAKLRAKAIEIGENYHRTEKSLYTSQRAEVVYGQGGQEGVDREAYSKAYNSRFGGARWRDAGARLDNEIKPTLVIVENFRGTEYARIPLKG